MESLFKQIETWIEAIIDEKLTIRLDHEGLTDVVQALLDKKMADVVNTGQDFETDTKAIIERQLSAAFEDETSFVTRYINILIDHKVGNTSNSDDIDEINQTFRANVKDVIDDYFDISEYNYDIREMALDEVNQSFDINDHFDINDYEDEIRETVSNTFETKSIDILIPQ